MIGLTNPTGRRLGFTDDHLAGAGSDRLVQALIGLGYAKQVAARITAHLDPGANHISIQLIATKGADLLPGFTDLADVLLTLNRPATSAGRAPHTSRARRPGTMHDSDRPSVAVRGCLADRSPPREPRQETQLRHAGSR